MFCTLLKKEKNLTRSLNIKKRKVTFAFGVSSNFYLSSLKYSLLQYFLKQQYINLNYKLLKQLLNEECGYIFGLNT